MQTREEKNKRNLVYYNENKELIRAKARVRERERNKIPEVRKKHNEYKRKKGKEKTLVNRQVRAIVRFLKEFIRTNKIKPIKILLTEQEKLIRRKLYRDKNKEKIRLCNKEYRNNPVNKEKRRIANRLFRKTPAGKLSRERNRPKRIENRKRKERENPFIKSKNNIKKRVREAFKSKKWKIGGSSEQLLGVSFIVAKAHIERQFIKGMSWNNYGLWHIDHILPISLAKNEEELIALCHYTNLQPLWAKDNIAKSNKILPTQTVLII